MTAIAAIRARPCGLSFTINPKAIGRAKPTTRSSQFSKRLLQAFGFSNGCAEFALNQPPPLVPNSLIASWNATGPIAMVWEPPFSVCAVANASPGNSCGEPASTSSVPATMVTGSSK